MTSAERPSAPPLPLDQRPYKTVTPPALLPALCNHLLTKPPASAYGKILKVVVGPAGSEKTYHAYPGLLCHYSVSFNRMLNGSFDKANTENTKSLCLEDVDVNTFSRFFYWLNTGELDCTDDDDDTDDRDTKLPSSTHAFWTNAVHLYIFAMNYHIPLLKNAIMDTLFRHVERSRTIPPTISSLIYANTTKKDPLRRFFIDFTSSIYEYEDFAKTKAQDYEWEFLFDVIDETRSKVVGVSSFGGVADEIFDLEGYLTETWMVFCRRYHVHGERAKAAKRA